MTRRGDQATRRRAMAAIDAWWKQHATKDCLDAGSECHGGIIRAHTVQNRHVLAHLVDDGHVYLIRGSGGRADFERVGRNRATTFTGYCAYHDNRLFEPIDIGPRTALDIEDYRQLSLLALRAISREYWAKLNTEQLYRILSTHAVKRDCEAVGRILNVDEAAAQVTVDNAEELLLPFYLGVRSSIPRLAHRFNSLRRQIARVKFHQSRYVNYRFPGTACVAASCLTTPEFDLNGTRLINLASIADTPDVALNVLPALNETWVLFHYHRRFENQLRPFFAQLDELDEKALSVVISKFLIIHCENTVFAPAYVESLPETERASITSSFYESVHEAIRFDRVPNVDFLLEWRKPKSRGADPSP